MIGEVFLDRYEAVRLLGEGGMGRVFLGHEVGTQREVVIKVMHDHVVGDPRFRQCFEREMQMMTRFRHPYAVALYDASLDQAHRPCIIMEYVPGLTLDALLQKHGRLNPARVGRLLAQLCLVMQAAHTAGLIHRDLTPVNVMVLDPGKATETVKVMDFGLARMFGGVYIPLERLTGASPSVGGGTPDYVCPEQVRGDEVDHRGDLYSIGVLLFKLLTGFLPFEHVNTPQEILQAHLETEPPAFADVGAGQLVPSVIEAVVQSCLRKYPTERPQSALELAQCYEKALGEKILPEEGLAELCSPAPLADEPDEDADQVLDELEAWMPEAIAVVKLRGFVYDFGGEVLDSQPGRIRFRLPAPATTPEAAPWGLWALLGFGKRTAPPLPNALLELRMQKTTTGLQNQLQIKVLMHPEQNARQEQATDWQYWCGQVCRDLRAYLISR